MVPLVSLQNNSEYTEIMCRNVYLWFWPLVLCELAGLLIGGVELGPSILSAVPVNVA